LTALQLSGSYWFSTRNSFQARPLLFATILCWRSESRGWEKPGDALPVARWEFSASLS